MAGFLSVNIIEWLPMKKLINKPYSELFLNHVMNFLSKILSHEKLMASHVVAVSGGVDSMTLLWVAAQLSRQGRIGKVRAVFVNHHTRSGQKEDAELVKNFCHLHQVAFDELHARNLDSKYANFEARARTERKRLLKNAMKPGETLWNGHHLNDSFEWHLMQKFRSSNTISALGIPVKNRRLVRPFLCVTKEQIIRLSNNQSIPFREDPTNLNLSHDRNFIRHQLVPFITKRYPNYLKFYSLQANSMALVLNKSLFSKINPAQVYSYEIGAAICGKVFSPLQIQQLIENYSNSDRGKLATSVKRMLKAVENGKKGPFQFSGGVEIYHSFQMLVLYPKGFKNHDAAMAGILSQLSRESLMELALFGREELVSSWNFLMQSSDALLNLPGLILVLETDSIQKSLNTSVYDPLFPKVSEICQKNGLRFVSILKCLHFWKNHEQRLPKKLRILPLFYLSNLFTFQE